MFGCSLSQGEVVAEMSVLRRNAEYRTLTPSETVEVYRYEPIAKPDLGLGGCCLHQNGTTCFFFHDKEAQRGEQTSLKIPFVSSLRYVFQAA